jgi:hypothetical protein
MTPIQACSMQRAIESCPDESLRARWVVCKYRTPFYYLALSELTNERSYPAADLYAARAEYEDWESRQGESFGEWVANGCL